MTEQKDNSKLLTAIGSIVANALSTLPCDKRQDQMDRNKANNKDDALMMESSFTQHGFTPCNAFNYTNYAIWGPTLKEKTLAKDGADQDQVNKIMDALINFTPDPAQENSYNFCVMKENVCTKVPKEEAVSMQAVQSEQQATSQGIWIISLSSSVCLSLMLMAIGAFIFVLRKRT